jgi:hypothetical protein
MECGRSVEPVRLLDDVYPYDAGSAGEVEANVIEAGVLEDKARAIAIGIEASQEGNEVVQSRVPSDWHRCVLQKEYVRQPKREPPTAVLYHSVALLTICLETAIVHHTIKTMTPIMQNIRAPVDIERLFGYNAGEVSAQGNL